MSTIPTDTPILVEFGWVGNSPQISEIYNLFVTFYSIIFFRGLAYRQKPVNGFARSMAQKA